MNKIRNFFLLSLAIVLVLQACALLPNLNKKLLDGTEWELVSIKDSAPIAGTTVTIAFSNGEVHGRSGCNTYFGSYQTDDERISFGPLAMTEMACLEPEGSMQQEMQYLTVLSKADKFNIENDQLTLAQDNQVQLIFRIIK